MLRWVAAMLLVLAGCLGAPPQPVAVQAVADDGVEAIAIRVEPLVHVIDVEDHLGWRLCTAGLQPPCTGSASFLGGSTGFEWEVDEHDYADGQALFWRVAIALGRPDTPTEPVEALRLELAITRPCGVLCTQERVVEHRQGAGALHIDPLDLYLEPGETGIRLRVGLAETAGPATGEVHYSLQGYAAGYRPVGDPIVLQ